MTFIIQTTNLFGEPLLPLNVTNYLRKFYKVTFHILMINIPHIFSALTFNSKEQVTLTAKTFNEYFNKNIYIPKQMEISLLIHTLKFTRPVP